MHGAHRIRQRSLGVSALLSYRSNCPFKISWIVHRVKNAENIYAVYCSTFNKFVDNVVGIMTVPKNILAAK